MQSLYVLPSMTDSTVEVRLLPSDSPRQWPLMLEATRSSCAYALECRATFNFTKGKNLKIALRFRTGLSVVAVAIAMELAGCAGALRPVRDAISPPGQMSADGSINPCHGYRSNHQACGNAIYNDARIGKVAIGQSIDEVRKIMGRAPEKRSVQLQDGRSLETWSFLTDYDNSITTRIEFMDSKVVGIKQESA